MTTYHVSICCCHLGVIESYPVDCLSFACVMFHFPISAFVCVLQRQGGGSSADGA